MNKKIKLLVEKHNIKTRKSKNGVFFYTDFDIDNRGKFKINGKVEYKTGYRNEFYISWLDMDNLDDDFVECFKLDLCLIKN